MRKHAIVLSLILFSLGSVFAEEAKVSEKQPLAIFSLGYYGYNIPKQALGSIDAELVRVFVDLKRFDILGFEQRLKTADVTKFIADLKKYKEANMVLPKKYMLGEAFLTEAEMTKLIGSFYIVMPVVTNYNVERKTNKKTNKSYWECEINTSFTFYDVANGTIMAAPIVKTIGSDDDSKDEAIQSAISAIPGDLRFEARKAFPLDSKVVSTSPGSLRMRLGGNMGIKKGFEFAVIEKETIDGIEDEREAGLVLVRKVGSEFSDATVLFSNIKLSKETQLKEIPRKGIDASFYASYLTGLPITYATYDPRDTGLILGAKTTFSDGFYDFKPMAGVEVPLGAILSDVDYLYVPFNVYVGGEYNLYLGRLQIAPFAAGGITGMYINVLGWEPDTSDYFSHVGGFGGLSLSYLATRDFKVYAEAKAAYWLSLVGYASDFGGFGISLGATYKM